MALSRVALFSWPTMPASSPHRGVKSRRILRLRTHIGQWLQRVVPVFVGVSHGPLIARVRHGVRETRFCLRFASARARPSGVLGPVLMPP